MSIRYFATNRKSENLGKSVDRGPRLKAQMGGYHFVDMKAYMSHYLAEVDEDTMPKEAIVYDSDNLIFKNYLKNKRIGQINICVHGFNVNFHEAQTWYGILTDSLRNVEGLENRVITDPYGEDKELLTRDDVADGQLIAFIGFSWPSNGNVLSYQSDQSEAIGSASALANLIARIRSSTMAQVNLICHSMGNYLACHMFKQLINRQALPVYESKKIYDDLLRRISRKSNKAIDDPSNVYFIDQYIMLAADIERRHITKCVEVEDNINKEQERVIYLGQFYSGLEHLVGNVYNFYSRFDGALAISNTEKGPRKLAVSTKSLADKLTLGIFDFLENNPDQKWEQRLGSTQHPIVAPPNMRSINAVELSGREIGHSDYVDCKEIVAEIANILKK